jgi:S1-C subfamily serine protease
LLIQRLQLGALAPHADGKRSVKNIGHRDEENLKSKTRRRSSTQLFIGTGFSFDDGEQVLVSVQKPLGIILEQEENVGPVIVGEVDPSGSAGRAGVQEGDILVAVQNASVETQSLEYVMDFLGRAPKVVNLRFVRPR